MLTQPAPLADRAAHGPALSTRAWWIAVLYIAAAAMFLRFYELPLKPLHHDEGVNALFLTRLVQPPHLYQYDPANYHGPTLYYFGWLSVTAFGLTTVAIRFVTAMTGFAAVLLILPLRGRIGSVGALSAAAMLALSPGAVYFSRYFIHEMPLVCFTIGTVVGAALWLQCGRVRYLLMAGVCAGLMFATKETAVISAAVLIAATLGAALLTHAPGGAPNGLAERLRRRLHARCRPSKNDLLSAATALGLFFAVALLFYTSLFTRWQGALDAVRTFAFWSRTGSTSHSHAWYTYLEWLSVEEAPLLLLGTAGIGVALWRRSSAFAVFAALWAVGMLGAYSLIPYKTPWLALNIVVPLAICGGHACEQIRRHRPAFPRGFVVGAATAVALLAAYQAVVLSFFAYDNDRYPYVYAHTSREVLGLVEKVRELETLNPRASITITSAEHFPLSWYLRDYPVGYYGRIVATGDPLVIGSVRQQDSLDRALGERYRRMGPYRLRPGVRLLLYARKDLRPSW